MTTIAYKVFTHDLHSLIQGGDPVWGIAVYLVKSRLSSILTFQSVTS